MLHVPSSVESSGSRGPHTSISLPLLTRCLDCVRARELSCQTAHLSLLEPGGAALWDEAILRANIDQWRGRWMDNASLLYVLRTIELSLAY